MDTVKISGDMEVVKAVEMPFEKNKIKASEIPVVSIYSHTVVHMI